MQFFKKITVLSFVAIAAVACGSSDDGNSDNAGGAAGAQGGSAGAQGGSAGAQGGSAGAQGGSAGAQGGAAGAQGGAAGAQGGAAGAQGGSAGAQGGSAGASSGYANCAKLCEAQATPACPNESPKDQCIKECNSWISMTPWCESDTKGLIDCAAGTSGTDWECSDQGKSEPKDPKTCATESDTMQSCWFDGPAAGLPDMTSDCKAFCNNVKGLSCAPADCETWCQGAIDKGIGAQKACRGALAAMLHCLASDTTPGDLECNANGKVDSKTKACDDPSMLTVLCAMDYCNDNPNDPDCKQGGN